MEKFFDLRRAVFIKNKDVRIITDIKFKDNRVTVFYLQAYNSTRGMHVTGGLYYTDANNFESLERNFGTRLI